MLPSAGSGLGGVSSPCPSCGPGDGSWAPDVVLWPGAAVCDLRVVVTNGLGRRDEGEHSAGSGMGGPAVAGPDLDGDGSPRTSCGPANGDLKLHVAFGPDLVRP